MILALSIDAELRRHVEDKYILYQLILTIDISLCNTTVSIITQKVITHTNRSIEILLIYIMC